MGMSASQARYLNLIARQNNLEYQGQQINQERSVLSQQCTALYNSLLDMQVPTPPSTSDFTTIEYSGTDGSSTFTLGTIRPKGSKHSVELLTQATGSSLALRYGSSVVAEAPSQIKGNLVPDPSALGELDMSEIRDYYVVEGDNVRRAIPGIDYTVTEGKCTLKTDKQFLHVDEQGTTTRTNADCQFLIAGQPAYEWDKAEELYGDLSYIDFDGYKQAIENKYGDADEQTGDIVTKDDFYVYFTYSESGRAEPHFAFKNDVTSPDQMTAVYDYTATGSYTKTAVYDDCELTFDSSGRITAINIPYYDKTDPEIITGYNTIALTATKKTDEAAYKDAYAKYEYAQYEYDKKNQEINAKTEIIQQEDRNLELKLQRLDNERTQIKTEIEALDKVIDENIEKSYKTFSG